MRRALQRGLSAGHLVVPDEVQDPHAGAAGYFQEQIICRRLPGRPKALRPLMTPTPE